MEVVSRILEETSFDGVANVAAQYLNAIDQSSAYTAAELVQHTGKRSTRNAQTLAGMNEGSSAVQSAPCPPTH